VPLLNQLNWWGTITKRETKVDKIFADKHCSILTLKICPFQKVFIGEGKNDESSAIIDAPSTEQFLQYFKKNFLGIYFNINFA